MEDCETFCPRGWSWLNCSLVGWACSLCPPINTAWAQTACPPYKAKADESVYSRNRRFPAKVATQRTLFIVVRDTVTSNSAATDVSTFELYTRIESGLIMPLVFILPILFSCSGINSRRVGIFSFGWDRLFAGINCLVFGFLYSR